jgi:hypothetical protein
MGTTCSTSPKNLTSSHGHPRKLTPKHIYPKTVSIGGIVFPINQKKGTFKIYSRKCCWTTVTLVQNLRPKYSSGSTILKGGGALVNVVTDCGNYTLVGDCSTKMIVYIDGRPSENLFIEEYQSGLIFLALTPKN